jgi:hypothetical protein
MITVVIKGQRQVRNIKLRKKEKKKRAVFAQRTIIHLITCSILIITEADKKRVDQDKVDRFISGVQCRRVDLDGEMDGRVDRIRCEEGEERCDICQGSDAMMEEAEALRQAYQAEEERCGPEPTLDSGIDIPSSQSVVQPSSPGAVQSASPGVIQSSSPPAIW